MMRNCDACGAKLAETAKFCGVCGTAVEQQASAKPPPPAPAQENDDGDAETAATASAEKPSNARTYVIAGVALVIGGALVAAAMTLFSSSAEQGEVRSASSDGSAMDSATWKATYSDDILSDQFDLFITGNARMRDFPTSQDTVILRELSAGERLSGRWVAGKDPTTKWLKVDGGGYVWEGNIGDKEMIYPTGMDGFFVGRRWEEFSGRFSPEGVYGDYGEGPEVCETYNSIDGRMSVMFEGNVATSFLTDSALLATREGIRVGSTEMELGEAYGEDLSSEPNVYGGIDYYIWRMPNEGLRFYVGDSGRVQAIWAGTKSIQYAEGCL